MAVFDAGLGIASDVQRRYLAVQGRSMMDRFSERLGATGWNHAAYPRAATAAFDLPYNRIIVISLFVYWSIEKFCNVSSGHVKILILCK
jgi:hypothetical protein